MRIITLLFISIALLSSNYFCVRFIVFNNRVLLTGIVAMRWKKEDDPILSGTTSYQRTNRVVLVFIGIRIVVRCRIVAVLIIVTNVVRITSQNLGRPDAREVTYPLQLLIHEEVIERP